MLVSQGVDAALAGLVGLLIGSFLNVVIYRLPKMLERQWAAECASLNDKAGADESVRLAADYVRDHLSKLLRQKPEIIEGPIAAHD